MTCKTDRSPASNAGQIFWLSDAEVRVAVVPRLGGRVLALEYQGREYLWRNPDLLDENLRPLKPVHNGSERGVMSQWQNWGGDKSWPAPQGPDPHGWPGPPDDVFDSGPFAVVRHGPGPSLTIESREDPVTGLAIRRSIEVNGSNSSVTVATRLLNTSRAPRCWAPWEITQLPFCAADIHSQAAGIHVNIRPTVTPPWRTLLRLEGLVQPQLSSPDWVKVPFSPAIGKVGFPGATGTVLGRWHDGRSLRLDWTVDSRAHYPEASPFQLWMQTTKDAPLPSLGGFRSSASLVELEPLGPMTVLDPGGSTSLSATWTLADRAATRSSPVDCKV